MNGQFTSEAVVIGAGVVGLGVARALALQGLNVLILEKNARIGGETSARNSEVIHAGIYYPEDSLKAVLCVEGRRLLYAFCESHKIAHKRLGKLIVATHESQSAALERLWRQAQQNGVNDLERLTAAGVTQLEPELSAWDALLSPSTGIIDSHQYMLALLCDAEGAGANLALQAEVTGITQSQDKFRLSVRNGRERMTLETAVLVNSAGLWAPKVAGLMEMLDPRFVPPTYLAKGSYVTLTGRSPFRHLVYPVPEAGGLGVHLTLDLAGQARFGPNVEWLSIQEPGAIDYSVPQSLPALFAPAIARYWPTVRPELLAPGYAGVRPKIGGRENPHADFAVEGPATHGIAGLVNLFGIESPGLTASLAIAERVKGLCHA